MGAQAIWGLKASFHCWAVPVANLPQALAMVRLACAALLAASTLRMVISDCESYNYEWEVSSNSWYEACCVGLDGTKELSVHTTFHSVNNDEYTTEAVVADDSGDTQHCADSAEGPAGWEYYPIGSYHDNFEHDEKGHLVGAAGKYVRTQLNWRITCVNPGSGDECQFVVSKVHLCNNDHCGLAAANGTRVTSRISLPPSGRRNPGTGKSTVMGCIPSNRIAPMLNASLHV